jgi:hypothetical protein
MKRIIFNLLPGFFLWFGSLVIARGDPPLSCCDVIQLDAIQMQDCSPKGEFQPVSMTSLETATVTLEFDVSLAGTEVTIQALDGGTLSTGGSTTIDQNGNLSFSFQVADQPGLYRISVVAQMGNGSVPISMVQFQVPNPEQ